MFTSLSVICQNSEYNLRILAYFHIKFKKSTDFAHTYFKKLQVFFGVFNKDYSFYTKILFFTTKDAQSFEKISFLVTIFTFLSVIGQNFEYNLKILGNIRITTKKSTDSAHTFSRNCRVFFWIF